MPLKGRCLIRRKWGLVGLFILLSFTCYVHADLSGEHILILVNQNSNTSRYIAKLYREYHPDVPESQVLSLSGLTDCSGPASTPADEIITRQEYEDSIAQPVRDYLSDANHPERLSAIRVILTTAGLPYRIEDSNPSFENAVYPAGSSPSTVTNQESQIDASTVESELTCLWYSDYGVEPAGIDNRIVNPYQAYRNSPVDLFEKLAAGTKDFNWTFAVSWDTGIETTVIEGTRSLYGAKDRQFNAGDIYLTARLDGPKYQGESAVFSVRRILERSSWASTPLVGVNPLQAVAVLDDAPNLSSGNINRNRVFNLAYDFDFWEFNPDENQPPDATTVRVKDDYYQAFIESADADPTESILNIASSSGPNDLCVMLDLRPAMLTNQYDLDDYALDDPNRFEHQGIIFLATFGTNGDDGCGPDYLFTGGPEGGPLFNMVNGAVFTSIESLNAVTMFSDAQTQPVAQGKLVDFIAIGGAGAIGHGFEPQVDAAIDNEFLLYNLLADSDGDNRADMTFVEAAFTAIPYLSWSEVVIGDPLMRYSYGPGEVTWEPLLGDANNDGIVNLFDLWVIKSKMGGALHTTNEQAFEKYNDLCDVNKDGTINLFDVWVTRGNMGLTADWYPHF